jgi:cytochrome c biogenesis protein CcmG/thiol:disulfide interchange protein DsbE
VAVLALAVVLGELISGHSSTTATGRAAPALPTSMLVPPHVTLASLHGQPAVVNFWASWCDPCRKEAPQLARLQTALTGRARLIGVDWNDTAGGARAFIRRYRWRFPNLRDADGTVGNRYGISGLAALSSARF